MHLSDLPARHATAHPVPDAHGQNLYRADPMLARLLPLYLPADLLAHLQPTLQRLGGLAGSVLGFLVTLPLAIDFDRSTAQMQFVERAPWIEAFAGTVARMPEIVECWRLGGDVDYLLRVVVPDMAAFDAFYRRLTAQVPSLRKVTSRFAMERVKSTTALPI